MLLTMIVELSKGTFLISIYVIFFLFFVASMQSKSCMCYVSWILKQKLIFSLYSNLFLCFPTTLKNISFHFIYYTLHYYIECIHQHTLTLFFIFCSKWQFSVLSVWNCKCVCVAVFLSIFVCCFVYAGKAIMLIRKRREESDRWHFIPQRVLK